MGDFQEPAADTFAPLAQAGLAKARVDAQLEKIRHSDTFAKKRAEKDLFKHLVEESWEGRVAGLKAAQITTRVFGKSPLGDSRVRGETGRLRDDLDQYYAKEAKRGEIRFAIPERQYVVYAARVTDSRPDWRPGKLATGAVARILEPGIDAEVHSTVVVRGRIESLHLDLRVWLVVKEPDGPLHPQCRVSRNAPDWEAVVRIGRLSF